MQKLSYEPIPKESSDFISIGTPTHVHPNNKNNEELLSNTHDDIEFLKKEFQKYYDKSSLKEGFDTLKRSGTSTPQKNLNCYSFSQTPTNLLNPTLSPNRNSIIDRQKKAISFRENKKRVRLGSDPNENFIISERIPEYLFLKQLSKTISNQRLIEYHKICCELSSVISSIIHFTQIHYEQKIPVSIDHQKFLDYCSSFFKNKESLYKELSKKEEILGNKIQQLSQFTKYKVVTIDQLRSELIEKLNIGNESENQPNAKKKKKARSRRERSNKNESNNDDNENKIVMEKSNVIKEKKHGFFDSSLDYAPYSSIDDFLFCYIHSHRINAKNQFHDHPVIEIQKIALEITGIAERNASFKTNNSSINESTANYTLFNDYLKQLLALILDDQSIFDIIKEKEKEKLIKIYQSQIKTVITIAFTRIVFDTAYLFNYDYLLNDQADENNHRYLHFNQDDKIIEINSNIIQNLVPSDLDIPDGFLIDYSMHKSHSHSNLQAPSSPNSDSESSSNPNTNLSLASSLNSTGSFCLYTPIKRSSKTIHELMAKEEDFLIISEKLSNLQFYSNPFDLSYYIYDIFNRIQIRLSSIAQMTTKKSKNIEKENGMPRSRSREFDQFVQFDDLFLFFLVVFTFNPPKNSRWIAAMLKKYVKLIPNMSMQQSASFFIAVVNYTSTFPANEEFSPELMERISQIREELKDQNS